MPRVGACQMRWGRHTARGDGCIFPLSEGWISNPPAQGCYLRSPFRTGQPRLRACRYLRVTSPGTPHLGEGTPRGRRLERSAPVRTRAGRPGTQARPTGRGSRRAAAAPVSGR
ncbi:unnamed protein product [Coccothraustes coccothraustes]